MSPDGRRSDCKIRSVVRLIGVLLLVLAALAAAGPRPALATRSSCDLYAAPGGEDSVGPFGRVGAPGFGRLGSVAAPFGSVQKLVKSLSAGQTGCLREGVYASAGRLDFSHGGSRDAPLTLASFPGEVARLAYGTVHVFPRANHVTLRDLEIDGSANPDVTVWVEGSDVLLEGNSIGNANLGMSCLIIGDDATVTVSSNRFGGCGRYADGNQDHAVYAAHTRALHVVDNVFWGTAGWAIHLYPDAQRSVITHNVIDDGTGGGVIFAGDDSHASGKNIVRHNILTDATSAYLLQSSWGRPIGSGNRASANCLRGGRLGEVGPQIGFSATGNLNADPRYVDPAHHDYRLARGSPCLRLVGYDTAAKLDARRVQQ
ncbi:MAG: hypothetical protein E6G41_13065 [Actinobacteria bacterium]|nr:MAG: hypothetical protein E6G41_13065 [Actinomycetota bacterium]